MVTLSRTRNQVKARRFKVTVHARSTRVQKELALAGRVGCE
jgi:hypothetical protein